MIKLEKFLYEYFFKDYLNNKHKKNIKEITNYFIDAKKS